jgi:hypothetical protein
MAFKMEIQNENNYTCFNHFFILNGLQQRLDQKSSTPAQALGNRHGSALSRSS